MMLKKKYVVLSLLGVVSVFLGSLFYYKMVKAQEPLEYDPWADINDDGILDISDIYYIAIRYGLMGTPINKTALLLELQSKVETNTFQSGLLLHLPYGATMPNYRTDLCNILLWLDLDQDTPGNQTVIFVPQGATITITGKFQDWSFPGVIKQDFFIYSWTPNWPPPNSTYYHEIYDGIPGSYPGVTISFSFDLTVPNEQAVYYLYFCSGAQYSIQDAVNRYEKPLWVPYAIIYVSSSP